MLAVARDLFAAEGYAAVGLEQVALSAGVTRGAVYHHYRSKQHLFTLVLNSVRAEVGRSIAQSAERVLAATGDPWQAFEVGCRSFLEASSSASVRRILLLNGPAVVE